MISNYEPWGWNIMPKYKSFEVGGYSISASPMGWRKIFHYPSNILEALYFAGDKVKFKLTVCQKQRNALPLSLRVYEHFPEYKASVKPVCYDCIIENLDQSKIKDIEIISKDNIAITGDGYYEVLAAITESPTPNKLPQVVEVKQFQQKILTFHAYQSEKITLGIYGFVSAAIGSLITLGLYKLWS